MYNRNDIAIVVDSANKILIIQGGENHPIPNNTKAVETGLFYSQVRHRTVVMNEEGRPEIMTPTEAKRRGLEGGVELDPRGLTAGSHHVGYVMGTYQVNIRPRGDGVNDQGVDYEIEARSEREAARLACERISCDEWDWVVLDGDRYYVEIEDGQLFEAVEQDGDVVLR